MRCSWRLLQGINKLFDPTASMFQLNCPWFRRTTGTACLEGQFFNYIYFQVHKSQTYFQPSALDHYQGDYFLHNKYDLVSATRTQDWDLRLSRSQRNSHKPQHEGSIVLGVEQYQASLRCSRAWWQSEKWLQLLASSSKLPLAQLWTSPGPMIRPFSEWINFFMSQNWSTTLQKQVQKQIQVSFSCALK